MSKFKELLEKEMGYMFSETTAQTPSTAPAGATTGATGVQTTPVIQNVTKPQNSMQKVAMDYKQNAEKLVQDYANPDDLVGVLNELGKMAPNGAKLYKAIEQIFKNPASQAAQAGLIPGNQPPTIPQLKA